MKILLDREHILTRGDHPGNPKRDVAPDIKINLPATAIVTHTPADLFRRYGFDVIEAERPDDVETAVHQYGDLRDRLLADEEAMRAVDQKFLIALKKAAAKFKKIYLEKTTYKLDPGENIDKVVETLKNMESNALFRAIDVDRENGIITTYASREGIWDVDGEYQAKSAELRSAGVIRTDRALRSVRDPSKKIDMRRANYPLFEETKALIESDAIKYSYASREQIDGSWRDDSPAVYVTELHFKESLTEEDEKEIKAIKEAAEGVKEETTHVGKGQATKEAAEESIEENEKEIHTRHEPVEIVKDKEVIEEIREEREDALKSYADRLFAELEERQKREREELRQKMQAALGEEREKAKQTLVTSLANGMTLLEAVDNLRAAKHNDILVQAVLEEVKTDMILAVKKDGIIAEKSKELEKTTKDLTRTKKELEQTAKANKTNHDNYILELNKRKEFEVAASKLKALTDRLHENITAAKAEITDLKDTLKDKDHEIEELGKELEEQFGQIEALRGELVAKDKEIEDLQNQVKQTQEQVAAVAAEKDKEIEAVKGELQKKEVDIARLEEKVKGLEEFNKTFKEVVEDLKAENKAIREEIAAAKKEAEEAKKEEELSLKEQIDALKKKPERVDTNFDFED